MPQQTRRIEIGTHEAPQHGALRRKPRQHPRQETRRRCAVLVVAFNLVQRAQGQAAGGQADIDGRHAERQDRFCPAASFQHRKLLPQRDEPGLSTVLHELQDR